MKKPNILIIVVDSMRADHVSCYGYDRPTTPNIDRLAAEGCLFENAITAAPFSPASYASIFSNLYPHQHGVNGDTVRVWPDHFKRLAEKMKANGYFTFGVSTNAFVGNATNSTQGFDVFHELYHRPWIMRRYGGLARRVRKYCGDRMADWMEPHHVRWPEMRASGKSMRLVQREIESTSAPFFGFVILMDPHAPYDRQKQEFCGNSSEVKEFFRDVNDGSMYAKLMAHGKGLSDSNLRIVMDLYDGEIAHADRCIGAFCEWFREQGLLDDTILVVTADHGEAFGEHDVWGHGFCLNDCLTRVPLVVRCPRYWPAGLRSSALAQLHDLHSLCLSVAEKGEPMVDKHPNGLTQAADPHWTGREIVFSEFPVQTGTLGMLKNLNPEFSHDKWGHTMWAVRSRDWRYVEYDNGKCELYDLRTDSTEATDVHDAHPEIRQTFAELLNGHRNDQSEKREESGEATKEHLDERVVDRLRSLGYID